MGKDEKKMRRGCERILGDVRVGCKRRKSDCERLSKKVKAKKDRLEDYMV